MNLNLRNLENEKTGLLTKNKQLVHELEAVKEYEIHINRMKQEIERLNTVLKEISEKNSVLTSELDTARRKEQQYLADIERLNNTLRLKVE